ncbi:MAG: DUF4265 domain-containing protein [Aeromicrobium sp.]
MYDDGQRDGVKKYEQLWTARVGEDTVRLACIPLFAYGMAWNDLLTISPDHSVLRVEKAAGHKALRAAGKDREQGAKLVLEVSQLADDMNLKYETHGGGYVAIDIPPGSGDTIDSVLAYLNREGVKFEYEVVP